MLKRKLGILLLSFVGACTHNNCYREYVESAYLNINTLPEGTELSFCKGGSTPEIKTVKIDWNRLTLHSYEANDRASRYDGSCEDNHLVRRKYIDVPVALTSASFGNAKLCYNDGRKYSISLVTIGEPCPDGTVEQTAPVDDCSTLNL